VVVVPVCGALSFTAAADEVDPPSIVALVVLAPVSFPGLSPGIQDAVYECEPAAGV